MSQRIDAGASGTSGRERTNGGVHRVRIAVRVGGLAAQLIGTVAPSIVIATVCLGAAVVLGAIAAGPASAQAPGTPPPGGDLFAPLTNLFNQAALSLSGPFGLAYSTAALLIAGAVIVADHRNGVRNALWVIIGSVVLFFGAQIIRMIHG